MSGLFRKSAPAARGLAATRMWLLASVASARSSPPNGGLEPNQKPDFDKFSELRSKPLMPQTLHTDEPRPLVWRGSSKGDFMAFLEPCSARWVMRCS